MQPCLVFHLPELHAIWGAQCSTFPRAKDEKQNAGTHTQWLKWWHPEFPSKEQPCGD